MIHIGLIKLAFQFVGKSGIEHHILIDDEPVIEALQEAHCPTAVERIGWPDKFVEHGIQIPFPQREVRVLGDVSMIPQESRQA